MKALVLTEYNHFEYRDIPAPDFGPDEVLIRVKACGICGSDVHGMDGSTGRRRPPIVMGHEAAGVIAEAGDKVTAWRKGDRVTFDSTVYCGKCWFCRRGEINLCDSRRVLGVSCDDYRLDGAFAQYVAVPQHILYSLPEELSFAQATLVETLSIALHAVSRTPLSPDDTALVVGAGMVGVLVVQGLRLAGCGQIIAVDLEQGRLDLACRLGADVGLKADSVDVPAEVFRMTGGRGADVAVEAVGITPAINSAVASLRKGGYLTLVGNLSPTVELPLQAVVTGEVTVYGSCASRGEYPAAIEAIAGGKVNVDTLISATAPLSEGASWFERLQKWEPGLMKVILEP